LVALVHKFLPFGIKHRKGRHDKAHGKKLKTCPLKRISPPKRKFSPFGTTISPFRETYVLAPVEKTLYLGKAHENERNKT
jgi:hypothetical protein